MTKLTLRREVSFEMTSVVDADAIQQALEAVMAQVESGELVWEKNHGHTIMQIAIKKYQEQGIESAADFMVQQAFREYLKGILDTIAEDNSDAMQRDKFSPLKFVNLTTKGE